MIDDYADQFGFYLVDGRKTYSKFEALEWAKFDFEKIDWNFNRKIFSYYDWKNEPAQDINYFYDIRARQLRDRYDYIILLYSSGYDTHNILKTFIDNNIHLDEIITCIPGKDILSEDNYEYQNYTKRKLEKYSDQLANTKIRVVEYADAFFSMVNSINLDDFLYGQNDRLSVFQIMKEHISKKLIPEHKKLVGSGKKICYLMGIDKPKIKYYKDKFFCSFSDSATANYVLSKEQMNRDNEVSSEFFYWSPDCVPMIIKQAQLLKKTYIRIRNTDTNEFLNLTRGHEFSGTYLPRYNSTTNELRVLSFSETFNFHDKTNVHNLTIYPRCRDDLALGYFFNGIESEYHRKVEGIFGHTEMMEKYKIYRCMGIRNTWLYLSNHDASIKMRKIIEHYISNPQIFMENNPHRGTKAILNYYEI